MSRTLFRQKKRRTGQDFSGGPDLLEAITAPNFDSIYKTVALLERGELVKGNLHIAIVTF